MSTTTVRLQPEIDAQLQAMSRRLHRSKSGLIKQALQEFIGRQELEQARWQETIDAMEEVASGKVVASTEVHRWLKSWGKNAELPPPKSGKKKANK